MFATKRRLELGVGHSIASHLPPPERLYHTGLHSPSPQSHEQKTRHCKWSTAQKDAFCITTLPGSSNQLLDWNTIIAPLLTLMEGSMYERMTV